MGPEVLCQGDPACQLSSQIHFMVRGRRKGSWWVLLWMEVLCLLSTSPLWLSDENLSLQTCICCAPALEQKNRPQPLWGSRSGVSAQSLQACPPLCGLIKCSLPGSSVHGILQARILEWGAMPSSRGSSRPRDRTHVFYISCTGRQILYH